MGRIGVFMSELQLIMFSANLALLLPVFGLMEFSETYQTVMFVIVSVVSASYVFFLVHFRNRIHRIIIRIDEDEYSNESDFPVIFAKRIEWLPLSICAIMYSCFVINHPIAKLLRDVFFIVVNVWFVYYTLNPHRTVHHVLEKAPKFRLTENKSKETKMEQVAMESGFSSGSAFSQVFKRIKGVTPKEFVNAE